MNFFQKPRRSFLGLSTSQDQSPQSPPPCHWNIPSPATGLSFASIAIDTPRPANVLESVAVGNSACIGDHGVDLAAGNSSSSGCTEFIDGAGGRVDRVDKLALCTESLGFENSSVRASISGDPTEETPSTNGVMARQVVARGGMERERWMNFPPILSSLKTNGRPRFDLRAVRGDGRLVILKVRNDRPEIVRSRKRDGRLRMHLIKDDQEEEEENNSHEEEDDEEEGSTGSDHQDKEEEVS
ncbi:protein FANTASTIC FOUR 1-like [Malania oleifera]|uniref:protein FANTASTIC FOUR 1-like n=1 Tax=Malania oleifera TaxID=397392 RepID=UPI0025AE0615|nr:protein FANTASTIC FOUR 1-like [Malania oleifera]